MTRTSAIRNIPVPEWGGLQLGLPTASRRAANEQRIPSRWSGLGEIAVGALLVVAWAMLWAFFIAGVVEPAAGMRARVADHPSLGVAAALPPARSGAAPGAVDTAGTAL